MKRADLLRVLGGLALVAMGFGGVILADRQGWLGGEAQACPHALRAEGCPWCTPSLIEQRGTCGEHGVPEALCSRCDAALIPAFKAQSDWCGEHAVPESQCVLCDPSRAPAGARATPPPPGSVELVAAEVPKSARPPSATCATERLQVQFLSAQIARDAGLEYAQAQERRVVQVLSCTAEVAYDANHYAHVAARAPGIVRAVARDLGDRVAAGELLAVVTSSELGAAKADLLEAQTRVGLWERNHEREQRLWRQNLSKERDALEAESELALSRVSAARAAQELRNFGLSEGEIAAVSSGRDTSAELSVRAPFAGTIVARHAALGEVVRTDAPLFAVADTSKVWALLDVREGDLRRVRVGQPLSLSLDGLGGEAFAGRVTWVSAELNRRTRTLQARAELDNPAGLLRAGMFGRAAVQVHAPEARVLVPKAAVQWEGCCNVVFVRQSERLFLPRKVRLGHEAGAQWVVESGLNPGETVVTTGSFLLKTEILKGSIGAGCCEPAR